MAQRSGGALAPQTIILECINPNGGCSRSLEKLMQNKELGRWRMNEVNVSVH
jgi:hypothetical protein